MHIIRHVSDKASVSYIRHVQCGQTILNSARTCACGLLSFAKDSRDWPTIASEAGRDRRRTHGPETGHGPMWQHHNGKAPDLLLSQVCLGKFRNDADAARGTR